MTKQAMQLALDALLDHTTQSRPRNGTYIAIKALREAIAAYEIAAQPMAYDISPVDCAEAMNSLILAFDDGKLSDDEWGLIRVQIQSALAAGARAGRARLAKEIAALKAAQPVQTASCRDAYEGAREDLLDWKRRALKAERINLQLARALMQEVNGPAFMGEPVLAAQPVEPASRHIHEHAAGLLIDYFLCAELGVKSAPEVTLEKQGESESESHSWAFWILDADTTSYLHEDGRIEWCGTAWEAESDEPAAALTATQPAPAAPYQVPDGWQLVPPEPDESMFRAVTHLDYTSQTDVGWIEGYRCMLAAAPKATP